MRLAIIGSGISGLSAAYFLAGRAEVVLYERDNRLGGHAETHHIRHGDADVAVDSGFMVFNPERYPNFVKLLNELGVETVQTDMSFSVSIRNEVEYSGLFPWGIFADPTRLFSIRFHRFLFSIVRFMRRAKRALAHPIDERASLGDFLVRHRFSPDLIEWFLYPMLGSIWSCSVNELKDYPAMATFRFLEGHKLLNVSSRPKWRTIPGGSGVYVEAIRRAIEPKGVLVRVGSAVSRVARSNNTVSVTADGKTEEYDRVIFATHADTALELLADASAAEKEVLDAFAYSENEVVLHRSPRFMPKRKRAWASWNYHAASPKPVDNATVSLTYNMNMLQHIDPAFPTFVTLNPPEPVPEEKVFASFSYRHPRFTRAAKRAQERLPEIQGKNLTAFAGAHWGYGFHEDGIASALSAVESLGFGVPWRG